MIEKCPGHRFFEALFSISTDVQKFFEISAQSGQILSLIAKIIKLSFLDNRKSCYFGETTLILIKPEN